MLLFFALLFGPAIAFPEISRWNRANNLHQREVCYNDDTLESFRYWRQDSEPYCSSLLGIQDITSTLPPATSRTTTTTVTQAVTTIPSTLTVPQITALETTTITAGLIFKRDDPPAFTNAVDAYPQPYGYDFVSVMLSSADRNAEIASSVFSACSCLRIAPRTVSSQATVQSTRIISGYNDVPLTQYEATVTADPYYNASEPATDSTSYTTISTTSTRYSTVYPTGTAIPPYALNTTSSAPPYPTTNASSSSITSSSTTSSSTTSSSIFSSSSTSSILPVATFLSINGPACPTVNNTLFTTSTNKVYQIQCYRAYGGPASIGLDRPTFRECIEECSQVNAGFSAVRCYGVTWMNGAPGTVKCTLKSQSVLRSGVEDFMAASAVLLTDVPEPVVGQFRGMPQLADDDAGTWRVGGKAVSG
ncbi:MAG: hypothetical protein Q9208_005074 [Pyrenodesmia sp. 3 TL-2023]